MTGKRQPFAPGDMVKIVINDEERLGRVRVVTGGYCKVELARAAWVNGRRTRVFVARVRDVRAV